MSSLVPAKTVKKLSLPAQPRPHLTREPAGLNQKAVLASRSPKVVTRAVTIVPPSPRDTGRKPPLAPSAATGSIAAKTREHGIALTSPRRKTARLGGRARRTRRRGGAWWNPRTWFVKPVSTLNPAHGYSQASAPSPIALPGDNEFENPLTSNSLYMSPTPTDDNNPFSPRASGRKTRRRRRGGTLKFFQKKPLSHRPGPSATTGPHEIAHIRSKKSKFATAPPANPTHVHLPKHGEAKHIV